IVLRHLVNYFGIPAPKASVSSIEDFLILPAFFSWSRELALAFKRVSKRIEHDRVGGSIGNSFRFYDLTIAKQLNVDRTLYGKAIVGKQNAVGANELERGAISRPERY